VNALDYYNNPVITQRISNITRRIRSIENREDCQQEIWAEIYDFMPLDDAEAIRIIERIAKRYKRNSKDVYDNETSINELPL